MEKRRGQEELGKLVPRDAKKGHQLKTSPKGAGHSLNPSHSITWFYSASDKHFCTHNRPQDLAVLLNKMQRW